MKQLNFRRPDMVALLVRLSGLLTLLTAATRGLPARFYLWAPLDPTRTTRVIELLAGLGLIYLGSQLHRKKRTAFLSAAVLLVLIALIEALRPHHSHWHLAILFLLILVVLLIDRREYVVHSDTTSLRHSLLVAGGLLLAVAAFVMVTFARIDQSDYGRRLPTRQTLSITSRAVFGQPLPPDLSSRRGRDLIFSLQTALVISGGIVLAGLFSPVRLRYASRPSNRERAERILRQFSASSEDYLKLWPPDKHYYFYNDSLLAYGVVRGAAVVIDGAAGDGQYLPQLRSRFMDECRLNGWQIAILHAAESEKQTWEQFGLRTFYLGSEARVQIEEFCDSTVRGKHFRYIRNRAEKDGLSFTELPQPLSSQTMRQLAEVSDAWLASGRHEYRFIMGYFDPEYLRQCRVFALQRGGRIVAYTNLLPAFQDKHLSVDHMRYLPEVSASTMHFLLMNVLLTLHGGPAETLNLGLAPLSKIEENVSAPFQALLGAIKNIGGRYYSFGGLEQFKGKFSPDWEPTYLVYSGLPTKLPVIMSAVSALSAYRRTASRCYGRYAGWLLGLSVLSSLCYASFPLAANLNPRYVWHGMVSALGQAGQPYADFFNSLDTISSLLTAAVVIGLLLLLRRLPKLPVLALYSLLISSVGDLLAAMYQLPRGSPVNGLVSLHLLENPAFQAHAVASTLNIAGYVMALAFWSVWIYRRRGWNWRHVFAAVNIALPTIGFAVWQFFPVSAPFLQRSSIIGIAAWFVLFCYDILQVPRPDA